MHGAVLKSYQINPSDFISQRAPTITEGTDSSHLFIGGAAEKYGTSNTSKTRMQGMLYTILKSVRALRFFLPAWTRSLHLSGVI